jgi:hypothetical protein
MSKTLDGIEVGDAAGQAQLVKAGVGLPVLIMMLGRGRVGKTATATTLVQFYRDLGCDLRVWNADQQNASHSLSRLHADVNEPMLGSSFEDRKKWLEERIQDQYQGQYDAVIDFAGGDATVQKLAQEVRLIRLLEKMNIRPVAVHVVGPQKADLDYLRQVSTAKLFMPEATIIILNDGLVQGGRSVDQAFAEIWGDPIVVEAQRNGAEVVRMPALPCMSEIMNMGLSFRDAADGNIGAGLVPLSYFDRERTALWWENEVPEFLGGLPGDWLPGRAKKGH